MSLLKGEYIYTPKGYKKVENVSTTKKVVGEHIIITLKDGTIMKVSPDHQLEVNEKENKSANEVLITDRVFLPKETKMECNEIDKEDFDFFELLGIFVCEGSIFKKESEFKFITMIRIGGDEIDFKNRIEYLLEKIVPYKMPFKIRVVNGTELYRMYRYGKEPYYWTKNFIDTFYKIEEITKSEQRVKGFLSGVLKSDACWIGYSDSISVTTTERKRGEIIKKCLECLGMHYSCALQKNKSKKKGRKTYCIWISCKNDLKYLLSWFKFDSYRDLKIPISLEYKRNYNLDYNIKKISSIERIKGEIEVYDI